MLCSVTMPQEEVKHSRSARNYKAAVCRERLWKLFFRMALCLVQCAQCAHTAPKMYKSYKTALRQETHTTCLRALPVRNYCQVWSSLEPGQCFIVTSCDVELHHLCATASASSSFTKSDKRVSFSLLSQLTGRGERLERHCVALSPSKRLIGLHESAFLSSKQEARQHHVTAA